ncbi:uracil-DNA glycosylase [Monosporozyma unispora]|nr:uracil DNA glycosylase [Kazachstania unispora]
MTVRKVLKSTLQKKRQVSIEDFFGKNKKNTVDKLKTKLLQEEISTEGQVIRKSEEDIEDKQTTESHHVIKSVIKNNFFSKLDDKTRSLLNLELLTMDDSWFEKLQSEFTKSYFQELKTFVQNEQASQTVFPPPRDIYSWTRLTPFDKVKVVIIGQDPYHNFNQAHGLAFSVKSPTPAPPSLKNIYKELKNNYSDFKVDNSKGDLTCWASQGVLLLNTSLTVRAHNANSHSKHGWEQLTSKVVELLIKDREYTGQKIVFLLWGNNAIKLVENLLTKVSKEKNKDWTKFNNLLVLKSVHPSPLSANRGFFNNNHFKKINDWLYDEKKEKMIDWSVVPGSKLKEVEEKNSQL